MTVPKGTGARRRMKLRPWQHEIIAGVLDEPRPRQALVSIPAGNGKSTLAAALGLYGLLGDQVEGAQVLVVASDERQARIIRGQDGGAPPGPRRPGTGVQGSPVGAADQQRVHGPAGRPRGAPGVGSLARHR